MSPEMGTPEPKDCDEGSASKPAAIPYMDPEELIESGVLQEVNRQFLHPLGLALAVVEDEDGTFRVGGVWDCRDTPEGLAFADSHLATPRARQKAEAVATELARRSVVRLVRPGYVVQPFPGDREES
ncbi:MAG: hypothetical protein HYV07_03915 [Deltaproteobacteria bacterium]|nr:hypothetical protein [Deltaproteobacteria bacterium]